MRKLTYSIFNKSNTFVDSVSSYKKALEYKNQGYTVKEKLVNIIENKEHLTPAYTIINNKMVIVDND